MILGRNNKLYENMTAQSVTISSGAISIWQGYHEVGSESGLTDDLDTISFVGGLSFPIGFLLLQASPGDTITVKHGTGNIYLNGAADFELSGEKTLLLFYDGTNWSDAGAGGGSTPAVNDLSDVTIVSPTDNEVLAYDSGTGDWINQTPAEADLSEVGHTHTESDITDLDHNDADAIHDNVSGEIAAITEKTTPVDDDIVVIEDSEDSNNKKKVKVGNLTTGISGVSSLKFSQVVDKAVANTTDETTLFSSGRGTKTIVASSVEQGDSYEIVVLGNISDTGNPTVNIQVYLGTEVICSTGAQNLDTSVSEVDFRIQVWFTVRNSGASGSIVASGLFGHDNGTIFGMVKTTETSIDFSSDQEIDVTIAWGTADASNEIIAQEVNIFKKSAEGLALAGPSSLEASETV